MILKSVFREIKAKPMLAVSLTLTLFLGLLAFNSIDFVRYAISDSLQRQSKVLLSADIAVTSRRPLKSEELKVLKEVVGGDAKIQEVWELYSMARGKTQSRLVQVKAVGPDFPFYGNIELKNAGIVTGSSLNNKMWVYPEILTQFNTQIGEILRLGDVDLRIGDVINSDFVNGWKGLSLAPRIYVSLESVLQAGLIKPGSTVGYNYLILLGKEKGAETVSHELNQRLSEPGIKVYSDRKASEEIVKGLASVSDYLGLVALVALFLAGTGVYFLFNGYVERKRSEIAVYSCLGLTHRRSVMIFAVYLFVLGLVALVPTWVGSWFIVPPVVRLLKSVMPFTVQPAFPWRVVGLSLLISMFAIFVSCASVLIRIKHLNAANLFRQEWTFKFHNPKTRMVFGFFILMMVWAAALYQSRSYVVSTYFILGLVATMAALTGFGFALIVLLGKSPGFRWLELNLAVKALSRQTGFSLFGLLALGVSFFLTLVIPQVRDGLIQEIRQPEGIKLPNLFLFDIQEEQEAKLEDLLKKKQITLSRISPMIRARLLNINEQEFEKSNLRSFGVTREEEIENRFRNRGFNLSYAAGLNESEEITEGKPFSGNFSGKGEAEISIERFLMDQLKLKLGDSLTFDVQGVSVKGRIVNVRNVRWTSFQPNFFILFQPGVLEDAPKTFLASISDLVPEAVVKTQNLIVDNFPNISVLDVRRTANKIINLSRIMTRVLQIMATLCLVIGFVILASIIYHHGETLRQEWQLYFLLGLNKTRVLISHVIKVLTLAGVAGLVGGTLSFIVSRVLLRYAFEVYTGPSPIILLVQAYLGLLLVSAVVSVLVFKFIQKMS